MGDTPMIDADWRADWLDWRRGGIGSSDVPALLGLSKWSSPLKVYMEKRGELPLEEDSGSEAMRLGRYLEPVAGKIFEDETGHEVGAYQEALSHPHAPWRRATVDFIAFTADEPIGPVEIKTAHQLWTEPPIDASIQTQWQMHVAGLSQGWILQLATGRGWRLFPVEPDYIAMEKMVRAAEEMWQRVQAGEPPAPVAADLELLGSRWPHHQEGKTAEIPAQLLERYQLARAALKETTRLKDSVAAEIKALMEDAEVATIEGEPALTWRSHTIAAHQRAESVQRRLVVLGE